MDYQDLVDEVDDHDDSINDHEDRIGNIEDNGAAIEFPLSPQDMQSIMSLFPTGTFTLVAGVGAITDNNIQTSSVIFYSVGKAGGTQGFLSITAQQNGKMTITSTSNTDTSQINYLVINPQ